MEVAPLGDIRRDPWPEPAPEPEPEYVPRLDTAPTAMTAAWATYIDQRIEERVEVEREYMCALLAEVVADERERHDKALADAREQTHEQRQKHMQTEIEKIEELKALSVRVESAMEQRFRRLLEVERNQRQSVIDLPTPQRRSDVN